MRGKIDELLADDFQTAPSSAGDSTVTNRTPNWNTGNPRGSREACMDWQL